MTDDDILTLAEIRALQRDNPAVLYRHLAEAQQSFLFGVEDHRAERDAWGGGLRIVVNRNLTVHLVDGFNAAMEGVDELPQLSVLPSETRAGATEDTKVVLDDGEVVRGVVFYVDPREYADLVADAVEVAERYGDCDVVPDTYFLDSDLVGYLGRVVLAHPTVRAEREFDFRRGIPGGDAPPPLEDEEDDAQDGVRAWPLRGLPDDEDEEDEGPDPDPAEIARYLREADERAARRAARRAAPPGDAGSDPSSA